MPKLNKAVATSVKKQTATSFEPLPEGTYTVRLTDVEARQSAKGNPNWSWTYEVVDGEFKGRRLWDNTSLVEAAHWRLKQVFDAYGVPADTDTDELVGQRVRLVVSQRVIPVGQRAGEVGNQVDRVLPLKGGDADTKGEDEDESDDDSDDDLY